jgi:hypothetical protein
MPKYGHPSWLFWVTPHVDPETITSAPRETIPYHIACAKAVQWVVPGKVARWMWWAVEGNTVMAEQPITTGVEYMLQELEKSYEHWNARAGQDTNDNSYANGRASQLRITIMNIKRNVYAKI